MICYALRAELCPETCFSEKSQTRRSRKVPGRKQEGNVLQVLFLVVFAYSFHFLSFLQAPQKLTCRSLHIDVVSIAQKLTRNSQSSLFIESPYR